MPIQQPPKTADELGLMRGFPPPPDARVTHAKQLYGPYNRWSFQNIQKLNSTADAWRGNGPVARFTYQTPNTDILAWIIKRLLDKPLADIMHERIWSKLGVERDACWVVGLTTEETSGSGLLTTLRDMARFGQMMLQKGWFNGQQMVPSAVVEEIEGATGPYRHQWWLSNHDHRAYFALGYGGQILSIDPFAQLVVAKFSSYPTPVEGGREFFHAFAALPALANELVK